MRPVVRWHEDDALPPYLVHRVMQICHRWKDCHPSTAAAAVDGRTRWNAPVIVIDGRSGSGKTSLANQLAAALQAQDPSDVQVLHLDSWYPGWDGLEEGTRITEQLLTGARGSWTQWDWVRNRPGRTVSLIPGRALVVEGAGALTASTAAVSDLRIWVDADPRQRYRRAMDRDGDSYRPWWQMWSRQEERHLARHRPDLLADLVVWT